MKTKENILIAKRYFEILNKINLGYNYNETLSKELNLRPNALIHHLKRLKSDKYLHSNFEKKNNKKIYSINWEKIIEDFYYFYFPKGKGRTGFPPTDLPDKIEKIFQVNEKSSYILNLNNLRNNQYAKKMFIYIFEKAAEYKTSKEDYKIE